MGGKDEKMRRQLSAPILLIYRVCFLSDGIRQLLSISRIATITFVHGPQGSGKTAMLDTVLKQSDRWFRHSNFFISGDLLLSRKRLIIDCGEFQNATSGSQLVSALAAHTGYWPMFTFLMGNLIDLASVGLIGQKGAGTNF
jgi:hypothetical protein